MIGVCLIDAHADLAAAWSAIVRNGMDPDQFERLCAPPVSGAELEGLVSQWKNPRTRLRVMTGWSEQAVRRYRTLRAEADARQL